MKINVGDYVRTKDGLILKAETNDIILEKNNIIKSSPNIIDLIEVGDYVNGDEVHRIGTDYDGKKILSYIVPTDYGEEEYRNEDIKSVVTKEQFKNMEYKI